MSVVAPLVLPIGQFPFQQGRILWHNGAKGECVNRFAPSVTSAERRHISTIRRFALSAISVSFLLTGPSPWAQNSTQQGEKSTAASPGNADTGKMIFTKDGCYECHGREGQGAAQGAG